MTATPDPKAVRELARKHIRSGHTDIGTTIARHFGNGVLGDEEFAEWEHEVTKAWYGELRAVSWPDEQPQDDPFAMIAEDAPDGPAYAVAEHWFSHAALIADSVGGEDWHAIADMTRRILDLMDAEQAERDSGVRAVARLLKLIEFDPAFNYGPVAMAVRAHFAQPIADLEARDAKAV